MFSVPVIIIAVPIEPGGKFALEHCVDGDHSVSDARVLRRAQPESHQRESIRTYETAGLQGGVRIRSVADRNSTAERVSAAPCRIANSNVISLDAKPAR